MQDLSRRSLLSLATALGFTSAAAPVAWSWSPTGSIAPAGSGADPAWVWDDEIDRIIAGVIDRGEVPAVNAAMADWVDNRDPVPAGLPDELRAFATGHTRLPEWADRDKLALAADFNRRKDTYLFMIYGVGSGIMSTAIPREARSVYWSKGGADMKDRAAKTFTFGYDLAQLGATEPDGQFLVTANKTRMVHAAVRHLLPQSPYWKAVADERIPISNLDILVTFHSTGTFAHKLLKEWDVPMTADDEEAFLHHWQVALHLLGVRDEYIPASWAAAHDQAAQALTPVLAPTPEGKELAEVLLGMADPGQLGVTRGFLDEFVRYQLGDRIADWLELRRDPVSATTIRVGWPAYIAFREGTIPVAPAGYYMFDQLVRGLAMMSLNEGESTQTTPITLPDVNRPGA